jgi:hypothetical protein
MDDIILGVHELLDQFLVGPGPPQAVLGIEEKVPGGETEDLEVIGFVDAVGISRGIDVDLVAELHEFLGENLRGGGNAVDAGEIGVGHERDFHLKPFKKAFTTEITEKIFEI